MEGLLRISLVPGSGASLDLALPAHVAVADLLPELVRLGKGPSAARLVTVAGREIDREASLADQQVPDGAVLALVGPEEVAAVIDDPAEALAREVVTDVLGWHPRLVRPAARACCALGLVSCAAALARGPSWSGAVAACAALLLGAATWLAMHRHRDRFLAAACGWAAAGFAAVAGDQYAGPVAACLSAAVGSVVIARLAGPAGELVLPAALVATVLGAWAALAVAVHVDASLAAAVGLVAADLAGTAVPRMALAAARDDAARGRDLMRALLAADGIVMVVLVVPVAAQGSVGAGLAAVVGLHVACRASRHHGAVEVLTGWASGAAMALVAGAVLIGARPDVADASGGADTAGAAGIVSLAIALAAGAVVLRRQESGDDLRLAVAVDRLESAALVAVVPLLVVVSGAVPLLTRLVAH